MNMLVNGKVVSCDKKIKTLLKDQGFKSTESNTIDIIQFRNSVTTIVGQHRVITENNYNSVVSEVISQTK